MIADKEMSNLQLRHLELKLKGVVLTSLKNAFSLRKLAKHNHRSIALRYVSDNELHLQTMIRLVEDFEALICLGMDGATAIDHLVKDGWPSRLLPIISAATRALDRKTPADSGQKTKQSLI